MNERPSLRVQVSLDRADFSLQVDLDLPTRGVTAVFGPSGSGKTTLLRCVAGLERATGTVAFGPETWQDTAQRVFKPTWQRDIGYVFQEASLFEHLNVRENVQFGWRRTRPTPDRSDLDDLIALLGIGHLLSRSVSSLSGGERQRVAMARALATRPKLLLLDEPLASLDVARRQEVLPWLERLRDQWHTPMLYVTHAVEELARMADHLVVLDHGRVCCAGPLGQTLTAPAVAMAMGDEAGLITTSTVLERHAGDHTAKIRLGDGALWVRDPDVAVGQTVRVRILARDVALAGSAPTDTRAQPPLQGTVESVDADGHPSQALVRVRCGQDLLLARVTQRSALGLQLHPGMPVWCTISWATVVA